MSNILIISFSDLRYDARITRQIRWLAANYKVTVICFHRLEDLPQVNFIEIKQAPLRPLRKISLGVALLFRLFNLAHTLQHPYLAQLKQLLKADFDLIIANDIETLPIAFKLKIQSKVVFDAHEYAPRHFEDKTWWRLLFGPLNNFLCKKYLPKLAAMTTVCDGLMVEYQKNFGIKPTVITNATHHHELSPQPIDGPIRLVHHGIINKSRRVENMVSVMEILGAGYTLDFIFILPEYASKNTAEYFEAFKKEVDKVPNINILPSIANDQLVPMINHYDIGLFLLEPINFNYTYALPNKLFDFVQGRLAVAIGPSIEMKKVVENYGFGIVSENFEPVALAEKIRESTKDQIFNMKLNAHSAARELSEEANKKRFLELLNRI